MAKTTILILLSLQPPLIHLLRRFDEITAASQKSLETNKLADEVRFCREIVIENYYLSNIWFHKIEHDFFLLLARIKTFSPILFIYQFLDQEQCFFILQMYIIYVPVLALILHFIHLLLSQSL